MELIGRDAERLEVVDRLPRSNVGKVDKRGLRERVAALVSAAQT